VFGIEVSERQQYEGPGRGCWIGGSSFCCRVAGFVVEVRDGTLFRGISIRVAVGNFHHEPGDTTAKTGTTNPTTTPRTFILLTFWHFDSEHFNWSSRLDFATIYFAITLELKWLRLYLLCEYLLDLTLLISFTGNLMFLDIIKFNKFN
jgi:hypothetical protein